VCPPNFPLQRVWLGGFADREWELKGCGSKMPRMVGVNGSYEGKRQGNRGGQLPRISSLGGAGN
jgi:hypothetical protein